MSYEPKPASVPFRAIAYLERQPHGAEVKTSVLAEAIGHTPAQLAMCLETAREAGAIFARKRDPHRTSPLWWSLVDHGKGAPLRVPTMADMNSTARDAGHKAWGEAAQAPHDDCTGPVAAPTPTNGRPPARNDSTPRRQDAGTSESPGGGPTGVGQPAAAGPVGERVTQAAYIAAIGTDDPQPASRGTLAGHTATVSMSGEVAIVAECGTVILFDAARGRRLVEFLAGRAAA